MYKWQKFSCIETPVWMSRLYDSGVQYRYTSAVNTAYLTAEQGKPPINGNGQFVWTGASRAQCSSSNYWAKYWASNNNSLRNGVAVGGVSDYFAIVTGFNQGILGATLTHSIYEPYIDHYDYSQGSYVGEVTSNERTAYPDNGRHSDGYWYVYVGVQQNLYVKDGGEYIRISRVYKKVNGVYSEQVNIPSLFPEGVKPLRFGAGIGAYGIALNNGEAGTHADSSMCITEYFPVPTGCTNVTVYPGGTGSVACSVMHEYDANKSYLSYWGNASGAERTFDFDYPAQIKYIRATFVIAQIDNCYIIDNTHGQYIYRGKNV